LNSFSYIPFNYLFIVVCQAGPFKVDIKQKFSCLFWRLSASSARSNVGGAWFCTLGIHWVVVACYWWISCEWQVVSARGRWRYL